MFIRRLYYDKITEKILLIYMIKNENRISNIEDDFRLCSQLRNRNLENTAVLEWTTEDDNIEDLFSSKKPVIKNGVLIFNDL